MYVQGSGGNLLARSLALSEKTVAYLPEEFSQQQPYMRLSATKRFEFYNNWDHSDWIKSESLRIWYKHRKQDFVNYENSDLWLIDQFHPAMFQTETTKQVLWNTVNVWEYLIFIKYQPSSVALIKKIAKLKRPDLLHVNQIDSTEISTFDNIQHDYSATVVNWEDMLKQTTYIDIVTQLSEKLNLSLKNEVLTDIYGKFLKS